MARREVDTLAMLAFARRIIRAVGVRVADSDEFELAELVSIRDDLEAAIQVAIDGQRSVGRSWAYIGAALGTSRQAAQARYARRNAG
ncbi:MULTISPECIES: hypothetical protein [unclassified Microbacterium]|uniref:hypothetical protein n=1 Tax=unclassified Microbacterium TaxID=2609290 RepID=UPI0030198B94